MHRPALLFAITLAAAAPAFADEVAPPPAKPPLPAPLAGPVPGAPGYSIEDKADPTYCGGHRLIAHAPRKRPKDVDAELDALLRINPPVGLDFDAKHKEASMKAFSAWFTGAIAAATKANALYQKRVGDDHADLAVRVEAAARVAIIQRRFGDMLARMQIPPSLRTLPDATAAYCDTLVDKAQPLWAEATKAASACATKAAEAELAPGWWSPVCVAADAPQ